MSEIPSDLKYTKSHEWIQADDDDICIIGITDLAQSLLGELVFVELPEVGATLSQGDECCVVESVKAASDVYAPLDGTVVEVNEALGENPDWVNEHPYDSGWLFKMKLSDADQLDDLLSADDYEEINADEAA